jgi:hypothetical protein
MGSVRSLPFIRNVILIPLAAGLYGGIQYISTFRRAGCVADKIRRLPWSEGDGSGWDQFDRRRYQRQYNGVRYGAVLATDSPRYDNFALNKEDNDRGLAALRDGKVDRMRVVPAKRNNTGRYEYIGSVDIEVLNERVLKSLTPMNGGFGLFWPLSRRQLLGEEKPW